MQQLSQRLRAATPATQREARGARGPPEVSSALRSLPPSHRPRGGSAPLREAPGTRSASTRGALSSQARRPASPGRGPPRGLRAAQSTLRGLGDTAPARPPLGAPQALPGQGTALRAPGLRGRRLHTWRKWGGCPHLGGSAATAYSPGRKCGGGLLTWLLSRPRPGPGRGGTGRGWASRGEASRSPWASRRQ